MDKENSRCFTKELAKLERVNRNSSTSILSISGNAIQMVGPSPMTLCFEACNLTLRLSECAALRTLEIRKNQEWHS